MSIGKIIHPTQMPQIGSISSGEFKGKGLNQLEPKNVGEGFSDLLTKGVKSVNESVKEYEAMSTKFANGENVNLHEMIVKGEHADINLRLMMTIKSKVVDAYQEIMRMPV